MRAVTQELPAPHPRGILKAMASASEASQLREIGKNPQVFHMSLELKSLAFTLARSRWQILLLQIGCKVRCV